MSSFLTRIIIRQLFSHQAGDLVYSGRKITAMEAERIGLVSRVIWHDKYNEYLMPTVQELASKSLQVGKPPYIESAIKWVVLFDATVESRS